MLEPIGQATQAAENVFGDASTWAPIGAGVSGAAGGFEFPSAEEIDSLISAWKARLDSITRRGQSLDDMVSAAGIDPAKDESTSAYMSTWYQSFRQLHDQHDSMKTYIEGYIAKLEAAKNAKQTGEQDNADAVQKAGGGVNQ